MTVKLGVVMDPIDRLNYKKDSTLAMLWAAQARDWQLFYMEQGDLFLDQGVARARMAHLTVFHDPDAWYTLGDFEQRDLAERVGLIYSVAHGVDYAAVFFFRLSVPLL